MVINVGEFDHVPGTQIDDHTFVGALPTAKLRQLLVDPRLTESARDRARDQQLSEAFEIRQVVQRVFEGVKRKNVQPYADYIVDVYRKERPGIVPDITLWTERSLDVVGLEHGTSLLKLPFGVTLIAIDGETQLAARLEALLDEPALASERVPVVIHHGRSQKWARQAFHDLNALGHKPNAAIAASMDTVDPMTRLADTVERRVPLLRDRVNRSRRQLRKRDEDVVTIVTLRGACVTLYKGIAGVGLGNQPVAVDDDEFEALESLAVDWFTAVTGSIGDEIEDRENTVAAAPAVFAAIGALGHGAAALEGSARAEFIADRAARLIGVNWARGEHWAGIAGKFTPSGRFSIGGSKETAYAIHEALSDLKSEGYGRIRAREEVA